MMYFSPMSFATFYRERDTFREKERERERKRRERNSFCIHDSF